MKTALKFSKTFHTIFIFNILIYSYRSIVSQNIKSVDNFGDTNFAKLTIKI